MTKNRKRTKYNRRKHFRKRHPFFCRLYRILFLFAFILCLFTYFKPEQAQDILQKLEDQFPGLPHVSELLTSQYKETGPGSDSFEVHFLDVGEGLSVLVISDGQTLLYDGGSRDYADFVTSYLRMQGVYSLDYVISSHYDSDHLGGLINVLGNFNVQKVLGPDYDYDSYTYESFRQAINNRQLSIEHPTIGTSYSLGGASFTVLSPARIVEEPNNNSLAIRLVNGSNSFLLTGDAEQKSEETMCNSGLTLGSDVICPGHHGSSDATGDLFLSRTRPGYAVISCGAGNDYGHPHESTLRRLYNMGVTVYRTDELGTIVAYSDGQNISWNVSPNNK